MKTRNVLLALLAAAVFLVGGALWWLFASRNQLIKAAIERFGPEITGVAVNVKGVDLQPIEGMVSITGLRLGNPKGYSAPDALRLSEMRVTLDPATLTQDIVHIKDVTLQAPEITYEHGGGTTNLQNIQKHVDGYVAAHSGGKGDAGSKKKFVIDNLYVRDAKVRFGTSATLPLPDTHLRDIGKKSNGATAGEVVKESWGSIVRGATDLAGRAGAAIKEGVGSAVGGVKKLFK
jgi:uncharacterized protein involved in outer membrane biogenesis